ncbi:MAG: 1-phosphofructokinase [Saprospiraceae bacterium]|nr:1-phosphofructokinase [Saprospiraceae bacterium]
MILCVCPNPSIDILAEVRDLQIGRVNRILSQREYPGGKGVHVAMALAELTGQSELMGIWGGRPGKWIVDILKAKRVHCEGIYINQGSRRCYNFKDILNSKVETELLEPGPEMSIQDYESFVAKIKKASADFSIICASGSWPKGVSDRAYLDLILELPGKKVFLDCSGQQLDQALSAHPYCIHINIDEGLQLFGSPDPIIIAKQLKSHCNLAAVSAGKDGLYLMDNESCVHAHLHLNNIYSTVGSGDCLVAGIAMASQNKSTLIDIARLGVACGAANCIHPELGMLLQKDVLRLKSKIKIDQINL